MQSRFKSLIRSRKNADNPIKHVFCICVNKNIRQYEPQQLAGFVKSDLIFTALEITNSNKWQSNA